MLRRCEGLAHQLTGGDFGTLHTHVLVSASVALVGNLGMALVLDYVFYGLFSWQRVIGILLILLGITWIEKMKTAGKAAD